MIERPTVAIIGAGFSGLLTAVRLLTTPDGPNVRLIERRSAFGRGAAYSTLDPEHLLNVRASNMSAYPEDPDHFVRWLSDCGHGETPTQFVRRSQYGDYLQALIQQAADSSPVGRFLLEPDAAVAVTRSGQRWRVELAMGRMFEADAVVIAIGNLPPKAPRAFTDEAIGAAGYVADPWGLTADSLPETGEVVLIGTGLSMVDVALQVARVRPGLKMLALSRRGLLPQRHLPEGPAPRLRDAPVGSTPLSLLRDLRREIGGQEWRSVLDGLRPHVHDIWRSWSATQRQRFLRHARPWWDVHRHRLAPPVASKLDRLMAAGELKVRAGQIRSVGRQDDTLHVIWTPRGERQDQHLQAVAVINCAGPNGDPRQSDDPLLRQLLRSGLIRSDVCRIGLDIDPDARLIAEDGQTSASLFAIGPITRGALWEITSVPDIRVQAAACANLLGQMFAPQNSSSVKGTHVLP